MKTADQIIKETLLLEAEKKVKKLVAKGADRQKAAKKVAKDMDLTVNETDELVANVEALPVQDIPGPTDLAPTDNVLNFKDQEEVEQAAGILMYKSMPWRMKSTSPAFISFDNAESLNKAKDALKRRWDFLENIDRTVAVIAFDNLDEYKKVLDYIERSHFIVTPITDESKTQSGMDLSEDLMDELTAAAGKTKTGRAKQVRDEDITARGNAYRAVPKGFSQLAQKNFSADNPQDRSVKVRKKWK